MRIVVYDLETKNKPQNSAQWKDYPWMGISVGCAYDFSTGEYSVYLEDNLPKLIDLLNSADLVAAFNHIHFDNNLLADVAATHMGWPELKIKANYDMLVESRAGAKVDMYSKGFKLDAHLKATLNIQKTGDGGDAPALHQQGKIGELVSYCLADVHRERLLFEHIWNAGYVVCEHGSHAVKNPKEVLGIANHRLSDVGQLVGPSAIVTGIDHGAPGDDKTVKTMVERTPGGFKLVSTTNPEEL